MLVKFSVKNFRGFADCVEIDFANHANYTYNTFAIKDGVVKNGIFYGPNGCGKSNLSMAIFDIVNHLTQKFRPADYYVCFANAARPQDGVDFEYEFQLGRQKVCYSYTKTSAGLLCREFLSVDDRRIFEFAENETFLDSEFLITDEMRKKLASNANKISVIRYLTTSFPLQEDHYLLKLLEFVNGMLWYKCLDVRAFMGLENVPENIEEYIIKQNLVSELEQFLNDVSAQKFDLGPSRENMLVCKIGANQLPFSLVNSTGTKALTLLFFWLSKLKSASFVFIDEFDAFYHFQLAKKVCEKLFKLDCQLYLSSHNTFLMTNDLLRPDCNFIISDGVVKPLFVCTEKELRFGHNIEKLYRGGAFET